MDALTKAGINAKSFRLSERSAWWTRYYIYIPKADETKLKAFVEKWYGGASQDTRDDIYNRIVSKGSVNLDGSKNLRYDTVDSLPRDWVQEITAAEQAQRGIATNFSVPRISPLEVAKEAAQASANAAVVISNELSFHASSDLNKTAEKLIAENPDLKSSQLAGIVAREGLTTAATAGVGSVAFKTVRYGGKVAGVLITKAAPRAACAIKTAGKVTQTAVTLYMAADQVATAAKAADAAWEAVHRNPPASPEEITKKLTDAGIALTQLGYTAKDVWTMARNMKQEGFRKFFSNCFAGGTGVLTERGWVPIEEIRPGDRVWSRPEEGPAYSSSFQEVGPVFVRSAAVVELHVGGRVLRTTAEHPFWARGRGWRMACELESGDQLAGLEQEWTLVDGVVDSGEFVEVYNFSVPSGHTYFVGSADWGFAVWTHNVDECAIPGKSEANKPADNQPGAATPTKMQAEELVEGGGFQIRPIGALDRPKLAPATKAKIDAAQPKNAAGQFINPKTGQVITEPTYGHIYGRENWRIKKVADKLGLNQRELDQFVNAHPQYFEKQERIPNVNHHTEMLGSDPKAEAAIMNDMKKFFGL